jgi:hypothetical protein
MVQDGVVYARKALKLLIICLWTIHFLLVYGWSLTRLLALEVFGEEDLEVCLKNWSKEKSTKHVKALPLLAAWGIWLARYAMVFEGNTIIPYQLAVQCFVYYY